MVYVFMIQFRINLDRIFEHLLCYCNNELYNNY